MFTIKFQLTINKFHEAIDIIELKYKQFRFNLTYNIIVLYFEALILKYIENYI